MMSATMTCPPHRAAFPQYSSSDAAFDEWSRQLAASQVIRRPSRSSTLSGAPMRITKPGSTSSSPRSSIHPRRRTLVSDDRKRPQHIMGQYVMPMPAAGISPEPTKRSQRPMSWHPASAHFQQQAYGQSLPQSYQQPAVTNPYLPAQARWNDRHLIPNYQHMSPMASHSCQTSPVTFSPLSLPSNDFHSQPCFPVDSQGWSLPQQVPSYVSPLVDSCSISPAVESNLDYTESFPPLFDAANPATSMPSDGTNGPMQEWRSFPEHGFDGTFPPTPENLPQMQVKPAVQSEESTPYESLPEPEDDGEILVGMGLYDNPDKYAADPGLNNYRSTLSSLLGGGAPRMPEPAGKGLKLEETWQPPESEDEDEDEEDDDEKEQKGGDGA